MTTTGGEIQSGEPVEVYRALNEMEAQVIRTFLESNDIPAMLRNEAASLVFGLASGPLAEVSVLVPSPLAERARELLEEQMEEAEEAEQPGDEGAVGE